MTSREGGRKQTTLGASQSKWDYFLGALAPGSSEKILDIGAGKGSIANRVLRASNGGEVFAVDPSAKRVEAIRRDFPEIKSNVAGAESLPYPDSYFDKAYATMALHHFADLDKALAEVARVLKPGGSFVVVEVDPRSMKGALFRFLGRIGGERMNMMTVEEFSARLGAVEALKVSRSIRVGSGYLVKLVRT